MTGSRVALPGAWHAPVARARAASCGRVRSRPRGDAGFPVESRRSFAAKLPSRPKASHGHCTATTGGWSSARRRLACTRTHEAPGSVRTATPALSPTSTWTWAMRASRAHPAAGRSSCDGLRHYRARTGAHARADAAYRSDALEYEIQDAVTLHSAWPTAASGLSAAALARRAHGRRLLQHLPQARPAGVLRRIGVFRPIPDKRVGPGTGRKRDRRRSEHQLRAADGVLT